MKRIFVASLLGASVGHLLFFALLVVFEPLILALGDYLEEQGWWE